MNRGRQRRLRGTAAVRGSGLPAVPRASRLSQRAAEGAPPRSRGDEQEAHRAPKPVVRAFCPSPQLVRVHTSQLVALECPTEPPVGFSVGLAGEGPCQQARMPPARKSCEGCRTAKTRCDTEAQPNGICSRCVRVGIPCVLSEVVQSRRRPHGELRVDSGAGGSRSTDGGSPAAGRREEQRSKGKPSASAPFPADTSPEMHGENLHWVWPLHRDLMREERDNAVRLWWIRSAFTTARRHGNWGALPRVSGHPLPAPARCRLPTVLGSRVAWPGGGRRWRPTCLVQPCPAGQRLRALACTAPC